MDDFVEKMSELHARLFIAFVRFVAGIAILCGIALILAATAGCSTTAEAIKPPPVASGCDAKCFEPCTGENQDTGVTWEGDPKSAKMYDALENDVLPELSGKLRSCDTVNRAACVKCLINLEKEQVITLPPHKEL